MALVGTLLLLLLAVGTAPWWLKGGSGAAVINSTTTLAGSTETVTQTQTGDDSTTPSPSDSTTTTSRTSPTNTGLPDPEDEIEMSNRVPDLPEPESPLDAATDVPLDQVLEWSASDPDGDALTFDVYIGTAETSLSLLCDDVTSETCDPQSLINEETYYWRVVADDGNGGLTEGDLWSFTTTDSTSGDDLCLPPECHVGG